MPHTQSQLKEAIRTQVAARGAGKSICPSEVARALVGSNEKEWRLLMKPIRSAAVDMALAGDISITKKGKPVDPNAFKGVYRLTVAIGPDEEPKAD
ncbi:MAG: DUF3253 domain-containing protein [Pseudomonadota bacterium]